MRLVCPKCAAQYEVDPQAIPENGRDVQCASCGNTWFQDRAGEAVAEPSEDETVEITTPRPASATADRAILDILRREAEFDAAARNGDQGKATDPQTSENAPAEEEATQTAHHEYEEDPEPASEYEYEPEPEPESYDETPEHPQEEERDLTVSELAARARATRGGLRDQPTDRAGRRLNLSDPGADPDAIEDQGLMAAPQRPGPVADLPDVESLKSSLRAAMDEERDGEPRSRRKRGKAKGKGSNRKGRAGFYLAVNIALLALAAYVLADQIKEALPATAPYVDMFVASVDTARRALSSGFAVLVEMIQNLIAGQS